MKTQYYYVIAAIIAAMLLFPLLMGAQSVVPRGQRVVYDTGVGPAMAGSTSAANLPDKARKFIEKTGLDIVACEREFSTGEYEVKLQNGIDMEFSSQGNLLDIEAPDREVLGAGLIKEIVPGRLYDNIKELNALNRVESIEMTHGGGYKVEFMALQLGDIEDAYFSSTGEIIELEYML